MRVISGRCVERLREVGVALDGLSEAKAVPKGGGEPIDLTEFAMGMHEGVALAVGLVDGSLTADAEACEYISAAMHAYLDLRRQLAGGDGSERDGE
ncbi:hypothetical protein [Olsenella urininfantis]|uniref:hypothetical protein n=1 Tax=Olsenella urininfantis TaxID=1871033 RepID=UPI0009872770|nr:hypothetical protein [Olsenella urininfantis]